MAEKGIKVVRNHGVKLDQEISLAYAGRRNVGREMRWRHGWGSVGEDLY